jgi:hypothetical protein
VSSPSNPTAAKPSAPTLTSRTIQLRTGLVAAFLATCAFFFFWAVSAALHHDRANDGRASVPAWIFLLGIAFLLAPYIISWFLISRREQKSIAMGAGVACGFFGAFVLVSPYAFMAMFFFVGMSAWNGPPDLGLMAAGVTLLAYMVISLWIVWSAFKIGKVQWDAFGAAVGVTAFYLYFGVQSLMPIANRGQMHAEQKKVQNEMDLYKPAILARETIIGLTACLLRNHMLHPEAEYPASLNLVPADWACQTKFATDAVPEFTLNYEPQKDTASGRVTDFQLTAMPGKKGIRGREPLLIDSRGVVFVDYPWEMENVTAKVMVMPSDLSNSQMGFLKFNLDRYIKGKTNGLPPATINADIDGSAAYETPIMEDGHTRLEARDYETLYFPPRAGDPNRFALSTQCKRYGEICLRSYFFDYDGSMHATAEPRAATADDPAPPRCEKVASECEDIIWDPI